MTSVEDSLGVYENTSLSSLTGLERLLSVQHLFVRNNDALISLTGLGQIDYTAIMSMFIWGNPLLSDCNEVVICNYLSNGGSATIENNAVGCNSKTQVIESCDIFSKINYQIFYDINQNKIKDTEELVYLGSSILLDPGVTTHYLNHDWGGLLFLDEGLYEIIYDPSSTPDWQLTTDSASYHIAIDNSFSCDTLYFGIYPNEEIPDMTSHVNAPAARCNEFIVFDVHTKNLGTTITNGTLWLKADEDINAIDFIDLPDTTIAPDLYGWHFADLFPGYSFSRQIRLQIPGPPDFPVGESLHFTSYTDFADLNDEYQSKIFEYNPEVRCSYDPNDKLVSPDRQNGEVLFEEDFIYTIRFQNTGNDIAYDVVIRDTLDNNLDASTFKLLSTSHPGQLQVSSKSDRYLVFNFKNIFLPDSTANLEGSQGYVSYMISPKDGLAEKTPIHNTAAIYFDLNPPIVTNTTESILVSDLTTIIHEIENGITINVFPNPTNGQVYIHSSEGFDGELQVTDHMGRQIFQKKISDSQELDLSQQSSGIYFISIQTKEGMFTDKIIKF